MIGSVTAIRLENLNKDGSPPETRLKDPQEASQMLNQMLYADAMRNSTRSRLRGLIDGNQPYSPAELRKNGQAFRTNVNFRESEAFLGQATGNFYDVFAEVPTYATVRTKYGHDEAKVQEWSGIITEEFDRLQKADRDFDYLMQLSQREMVLIGIGPMCFEDATNWKCKAIMATELLVPDGTKSNTSDWKVAMVRVKMGVDELYQKIENEDAATANGWDVEACKKSIMDAMPEPYRRGTQWNWEYVQQQLRDNNISYSARCDVVLATHVLYKEFDGKISHRIIDERNTQVFLYSKIRRFDSWDSVIHPMYYDRGDGTHHGVKGLGIKMYQAMELKNRLWCATFDAAFARTQIMFKPNSPNALNKTSVVQMGPYSILPPDYDVVQTNISGVLDAPMAAMASLDGVIQGNTAQYRQTLTKPQGNPRTATEIQAIISQQSALGKTQLNRYYEQLDRLFEEKYRRAVNLNLPPNVDKDWDEAIAFQQRCVDRGVPKQALLDVDYVQATRTVGQGSQFVKQQVLGSLLNIAGMIPSSGQQNLLSDYVASLVGQQMVNRYVPQSQTDAKTQDQVALATLEHTSIHTGNPAIVTDTQNHPVHCTIHLQAATEAANSLQQGGNPQEVLLFLQGIEQHVSQHLQKMQNNPIQANMVKMFAQQLQEMDKVVQELASHVQEQAQAQAQMRQAQAIQSGQDPKTAILAAQTQQQIMRDNQLAMAEMQRKAAKSQVDSKAKIAKTTADINRANAQAAADINRSSPQGGD